jgi:His/Glu/Gln/Arg/opine family amino acid ABC transporter permease subunit
MMKVLLSLSLMCLAGCTAVQDKREPLVVGMELTYPPFEFVDEQGNPDGVSVRMAEALADYLDRPLKIENIKFDALITALKSGSIDCVISSMTANDERRKSIDFSDPYVTTGLAMLVGRDSDIKGLDDLKKPGRIVVARLGTTGENFVRQHLPDAKLNTMQEDPACALEVAQGKADAWIYDQLSIFQHHKNHAKSTRALLTPLRPEQWAIGLRKGKDGEVNALRDSVNVFLRQFRESGGFEKLAGRYLKEERQLVSELGIPFIFDSAPVTKKTNLEVDPYKTQPLEVDWLFILLVGVLIAVAIFTFWRLTMEGKGAAGGPGELLGYALLWLLVSGLCYFVFASLNQTYTWNWEGIWLRRWQLFGGWLRTIWISLVALVLCAGVGIALVAGSRSKLRPLRFFCRAYTEVVRGSPLLVVLLVGYYVIAQAFNVNDRILIGVILLALFAGAYLGEILRGGIESIGRTQFDSARAVGFSSIQVFRYVILPQAIRRVLPAVAGLFIILVKDSSLLSQIAIEEFTKRSESARSATYTGLEAYIPLAIGYLLITIPLAYLATCLERRFSYES